MNIADKIIVKLNEVFKKFDDAVLVDSKNWARGRVVAIQEFKRSEEADKLRYDSWGYYGSHHRSNCPNYNGQENHGDQVRQRAKP